MMRGSVYAGGPAGFSMATQNDVPMAAKAHVLGQAFLGIQMKCARCHDAPQHELRQEQLFQLAAMLSRKPQKVPHSSSIPSDEVDLSSLLVEVSLKPGSEVSPVWPFQGVNDIDTTLPEGILQDENDTRERLAAIITCHSNQRICSSYRQPPMAPIHGPRHRRFRRRLGTRNNTCPSFARPPGETANCESL